MKKNVLFWIAVHNKDPHINQKHGDFKYFEYSRNTWESWCKKNDVIFYHYNEPTLDDIVTYKPTWQRWFDVFKQLEENNIEYNKICVVDSSTMIRWDSPNFFDLCPDGELTAFRSLENLRWINESSQGYKNLFGGFDIDLTKYINCGVQIFDKEHKKFLDKLIKFYNENYDEIQRLQNEVVKKGTDQPVYNYLLQTEEVKLNLNLPTAFHVTHMSRFDWFSHNWQDGEDKTPFFIKYGYLWSYSGFPARGDRENLMKQTWDIVKDNYK